MVNGFPFPTQHRVLKSHLLVSLRKRIKKFYCLLKDCFFYISQSLGKIFDFEFNFQIKTKFKCAV